jgi:hypothetical protein
MEATKPVVSKKRAVATSLCSLAGLFLLSTALLVAGGHRPFQATWGRFSSVQKQAAARAPPGGRRHDAVVVAPATAAGDDEEEDAGSGSLAPAPAPAAAVEEDDSGGECDMSDGTWVRDDDAWYPMYEAAECPFLSDQVACRRNGRPDSGYEQWRWRPRGCPGRTRLVLVLGYAHNTYALILIDIASLSSIG